MNKGFTLIELLLVIAILSLIVSVIIPVSYDLYISYIETHEIEKFVVILSGIRRESFLYNRENVIHEKNGIIYVNDRAIRDFNFKFQIDSPVIFYKNGTSSGGIIKIIANKNSYKIQVSSPLGEIHYEKM